MSIEISHIVVNGCSFTYCQGLENPSEQGWPTLLAKKFNVPVVNLSVKGSGNDSIYRRTLDYHYTGKNYNSKPLYIIAFSQALRREEYITTYKNNVINNFCGLTQYGDEPIERSIYEHLDENGIYHMEFKKLLYWISVVNLFKVNNIPYLTTNYMNDHLPSLERLKNNHKNLYESVHEDKFRVKNFHDITEKLDRTKCGHDGLISQSAIADYCYNILHEKFNQIRTVRMDNYFSLDDYVYSKTGNFFEKTWNFNDAWLKNKPNV